MNQDNYDVIIVGGRPAGATLAARLGQAGLRVLLLERESFPRKHPASAPAIYARTLSMLDEIGAREEAYAANTPRVRRWVVAMHDLYDTISHVPSAFGRDYGYAIDRGRFDAALWRTAAETPGVLALTGSVGDIIWDGPRVTGVKARVDGRDRPLFADLVVGADGRFSTIARRVQAHERLVRNRHPSSLLYAYWQDGAPYDDQGATVYIHAGHEAGIGYLLMDSADRTLAVVMEGHPDKMEPAAGQSTTAFYINKLRAIPAIWRRIQHATLATPVSGMKRVGNLYRQAGGPGWALVGDALHQKDPLDGQGIYDAVFTARELARAIIAWKQGGLEWDSALKRYWREVHAETRPMYHQTLESVRSGLYAPLRPVWLQKTVIRWLMRDPVVATKNNLKIIRALPAEFAPPTPRELLRAIGSGLAGDVRSLLTPS